MTDRALTRPPIVHRGLPAVDERLVSGARGFVRLVDLVASVPLTLLGFVVVAAALVFRWPLLALTAATVTCAILVALREDTRLQKALDLLGRGEIDRARPALQAVADSTRRTPRQRHCAALHLGSIAFAQGHYADALEWVRRCPDLETRARFSSTERFLSACTRAQLHALCGDPAAARRVLGGLAAEPPGELAHLAFIATRLLVDFLERGLTVSAADLEVAEAFVRARDGTGVALVLLAWARSEQGQHEVARELLAAAREQGDLTYVERAYPLLGSWARAFGPARL